MNNIIRENLNEMVNGLSLKLEKGRFSDKSICSATLFNGQVARFADKENKLYNVLKVYKDMGYDPSKIIKSKKLVEREKKTDIEIDTNVFNDDSKTFIAISYTLDDGYEYLLFPEKRSDTVLINLSYEKFKESQKAQKIQK